MFVKYVELAYNGASLVDQTVRICLLVRDTWVRSLGQEDPLEKETAIHSSVLARQQFHDSFA